MPFLTPVAEEAQQAGDQRARAGTAVQWLILSCYLLGAVALTWRLWADPASRAQIRDPGDADQFVWFLRYSAAAISHGRLPALLTTAMNAPQGVNLMWNTAALLLGILLTPLTLLAGPQVSATTILTLGFAGSAASLFLVLRRWGASRSAAALGGAIYGFSPFLVSSGVHLQLEFAVLPPLIIDALLRIITGRGSTVRTGIWLGLLVSAQLFIGEELLLFTVIAGALLTVVLALNWPRVAIDRAAAAVPGLAIGSGVALLICGRALWVQFRDRVIPGSRTSAAHVASHVIAVKSDIHSVVTRPRALLHTTATGTTPAPEPHHSLTFLWGDGPMALLNQLHWPLFIVLVAAAILFWRNPKVRVAAVMFAVLDLLALGGRTQPLAGLQYPGYLHPWYWLARLPVLNAALAGRIVIVADGAAGALLAFCLDQARSLVPAAWNRRNAGSVITAAAILLTVPIVPRAYQVTNVAPLPAGWQATFASLRLPADASVLIAPFPYGLIPQPLRWQAETGEPASMIGGDFIGFSQNGHQKRAGRAALDATAIYIDALWTGSQHAPVPSHQQISADLAFWRPAAVVAVTSPDSPLGRFLIGLFGHPAYQIGSVLSWRLHPAGISSTASATRSLVAHAGAARQGWQTG
ncbi:MAG TPA: hypothetical protein VMA72_06150 [Streptosporangiaceae bacterium]|nr:hypothetical protein [Streptosporangiaceae bacterium]